MELIVQSLYACINKSFLLRIDRFNFVLSSECIETLLLFLLLGGLAFLLNCLLSASALEPKIDWNPVHAKVYSTNANGDKTHCLTSFTIGDEVSRKQHHHIDGVDDGNLVDDREPLVHPLSQRFQMHND